jgi:hypothetical protein
MVVPFLGGPPASHDQPPGDRPWLPQPSDLIHEHGSVRGDRFQTFV